MTASKLFFNWSSGKDSALSLHYLQQDARYNVALLLTTINSPQDRISMHGVRRELLLKQFANLEIPHKIIDLPENLTLDSYNSIMNVQLKFLQQEQYQYAAFGDILLEDVKAYREDQLKLYNIEAVFPLWQKNTLKIVHEFIEKGFKAIVVSVNAGLLDQSFCGRLLDKDFIKDLPAGIDPCGENGEYHTFCFDGPIFKKPVAYTLGDKVYKEYDAPKDPAGSDGKEKTKKMGFWFCDLIPGKL